MTKDTSITLDADEKDTIQTHRHHLDPSWGAALTGRLSVIPNDELFHDGCARCDYEPSEDERIEETTGFIHHISQRIPTEDGTKTVTETAWFCSPECVKDYIETRETFVDSEPDLVTFGGTDLPRVEFEHAETRLTERGIEVSLDIPGALHVQSVNGDEYTWEGEPVYVKNNGQWTHEAVVDRIDHDASATYIDTDWGSPHDTKPDHPSEDKREVYWSEWDEEDCPECGGDLRVKRKAEAGGSYEDCLDCEHSNVNSTPRGEEGDGSEKD